MKPSLVCNTSDTCVTFNSPVTICMITDRCPFINIIHLCQSAAFLISLLDDSCAQLGLLKLFLYIKDFLIQTIQMLVLCCWECLIWSCTVKICSAFCPHRAKNQIVFSHKVCWIHYFNKMLCTICLHPKKSIYLISQQHRVLLYLWLKCCDV